MRVALNDLSDVRRPILAARWTPAQAGSEWFVKEEIDGSMGAAVYGPMREDQVPLFIAERRAMIEDMVCNFASSLT